MKYHHTIRQSNAKRQRGFTLTEMLVATALVMLIMLMFAQIYGSAVGSIREQRALANNDQKARSVETTLRQDLLSMTYRQPRDPYGNVSGIVPLSAGDTPIVDPVNQRGYFYYSENNPNIDDDVLQFTIMRDVGQRGDAFNLSSKRPYEGKVDDLSILNEPDDDDGDATNRIGASRAAEVVYFLRKGNLYRRLLLLRDPLPAANRVESQPTVLRGSAPNEFESFRFNPNSQNYTANGNDFLEFFDYSATRLYHDSTGTGQSYLWLNSIDSLANHVGIISNPIALPHNRFGFFNNPTSTFSNEHGMPREYIDEDPANDGDFIGRFTHRETSSSGYNYPGIQNEANRRSNTLSALDTEDTVPGLTDGSRIAEDILLINVESFNVELFDDAIGNFVDLGGSSASDYRSSNRNNDAYGPRTSQNNIFDTWHPNAGTGTGVSPYRVFEETAGTVPWAANASASTGTLVAIPALNTPPSNNRSLVYKALQGGTSGGRQPEFIPEPGVTIQDGTIVWECIDNRVGLKAIRITIRFRDAGSNTPRQLTVVHSFVE